MKIAVTIIATGKYSSYADDLIKSLAEFFPPHDIILFTDTVVDSRPNLIKIWHPHLGWPQGVMNKFHAHIAQEELLKQYDYILHLDADMLMVHKTDADEIFTKGITATLHPSYPNTFERNRNSSAFVAGDHTYFHTAPIAGDSRSFLSMCHDLVRTIDIDASNDILAVWHDESHVNRYLVDHPPAKVLTPLYCFPDPQYIKYEQHWTKGAKMEDLIVKIRHIEKPNKMQFRRAASKKTLIAIMSCHAHRNLQAAQRHTWLKDLPLDMYRFFLGNPAMLSPAADEVFLDVGDGRDEAMTQKAKAIFRWALDNDYTHVFKCDTDTLANAKNLLNSDYEQHDYTGGKNIYFASGGSGYWLSRRAMQLVVEAKPFDHEFEKDEDVTTFKILEQNGIPLNADARYKFSPGSVLAEDTISYHLSSVFGWGSGYVQDTMYTYYNKMRNINTSAIAATTKSEKPIAAALGAKVYRDGKVVQLDINGREV